MANCSTDLNENGPWCCKMANCSKHMLKRAWENIGIIEKMLIDLIENCPCCGKSWKMATMKQKKEKGPEGILKEWKRCVQTWLKTVPVVERFVKWRNVGKHMITRAEDRLEEWWRCQQIWLRIIPAVEIVVKCWNVEGTHDEKRQRKYWMNGKDVKNFIVLAVERVKWRGVERAHEHMKEQMSTRGSVKRLKMGRMSTDLIENCRKSCKLTGCWENTW